MSSRTQLTHGKTGSRRSHHRISVPHLVKTKTGVRRRHFVDPDTGMYRGKQILTIGNTKNNKPAKAKSSAKITSDDKKDAKKVEKKVSAEKKKEVKK